MPLPASAMVARASSSCWRQSQRREWKTSPVRHWEWMRTMGGAGFPLAADAWMSPMTRATADSVRTVGAGMLSLQAAGFSTMPSKPRMRKWPQRVGKSASATLVTLAKGMIRLYVSVLMEVRFAWGRVRCGRPRIGAEGADLGQIRLRTDKTDMERVGNGLR